MAVSSESLSVVLRRLLRRALPAPWRLRLRLAVRRLSDSVSGVARRIGTSPVEGPQRRRFRSQIRIEQPIRSSRYLENKLHNLRLAAGLLEWEAVAPDGVFSYWKLVGVPSEARGFRRSRTLLGDELTPDVGGGLCQLGGLLYHLALRANLEIRERHSHSRDIYTEDERFTPLGADAAVVYGYRDLRFTNTSGQPIAFRFRITRKSIVGELCSPGELPDQALEFQRAPLPDGRIQVTTYDIDRRPPRRLAISTYLPYDGPQLS